MTETVLSCFGPGQYEKEGAIVGRLLAGYGELEMEMTVCVGAAVKDLDDAIRAMFSVRGEERRINLAKSNLRIPSTSAGLQMLTKQILSDMEWCKAIRNQYAHCQWYPTRTSLGFVNLEEVALIVGPLGLLEQYRHNLDHALLLSQEEFFVYVRKCFWHLTERFKNWAQVPASQAFPLPSVIARPPKSI